MRVYSEQGHRTGYQVREEMATEVLERLEASLKEKGLWLWERLESGPLLQGLVLNKEEKEVLLYQKSQSGTSVGSAWGQAELHLGDRDTGVGGR